MSKIALSLMSVAHLMFVTNTVTVEPQPVTAQPAAPGYIPPPKEVRTDPYRVGVFMCPLWKTGAINGKEWNAIVPFPERQPVLGWYDEGDPEVTDWEIKYLLEHGITFGITCWYRDKGNLGQPVKPWLGHWLHEGLFKSRYGDRFTFAIMWENIAKQACGLASEKDLLENLLPFWVENYFRRPNYLRVDGKPVLMIYGISRFIDELGGEEQAKAAVAKMRDDCRDRGFGGLTIVGEHHVQPADHLLAMANIGIDGVASYHWPTFTGAFPREPNAEKLIAAQQCCWRELVKYSLPAGHGICGMGRASVEQEAGAEMGRLAARAGILRGGLSASEGICGCPASLQPVRKDDPHRQLE